MTKRSWKNYGKDWPEGCRPCVKCGEVKAFSEFHFHKQCYAGVNTVCKTCRDSITKVDWLKKDYRKKVIDRVRGRCKVSGIDFDLSYKDVVIPDVCPVFGTKFIIGDSDYSPSIDRIDPKKGYVKGNVQIISNKANRIKSNASVEDLRKVYEFCRDSP